MVKEEITATAPPPRPVPSLRASGSGLTFADGRVFRSVPNGVLADLRQLLTASTMRALVKDGSLVATLFEPCGSPRHLQLPDCTLAEHESIAFPSYPYEWSPAMLHAAAELTLRLARQALESGFVLKSALAYNVLFRGPNPVFADMLSFEPREGATPASFPYTQFVRMFLLPLQIYAHAGLDPRTLLLANPQGIEYRNIYKLIPAAIFDACQHDGANDNVTLLDQLDKHLAAAKPGAASDCRWTDSDQNGYGPEQARVKQQFVSECFRAIAPARVLDIGCATGEFSIMAARAGASVVAVDSDSAAVDRLWRCAFTGNLDILPLSMDIANPTPDVGWKNGQFPSFLSRAQAMGFDCVLMPAFLPQLSSEGRLALPEMISLSAELTTDGAIVEYGGVEDPSQSRDLHKHCTPDQFEQFETVCLRQFRIERMLRLPGSSRALYLLRKRR